MLKTSELTTGAMGCALSVLLLFICTLIPSGKIAIGFIASFVPCVLYIECKSLKTSLTSGITSGLIALLLLPKSGLSGAIIVLYCLCLCYYPAVKAMIEKKNKLVVEWIYKEIFFLIISVIFKFATGFFGISFYNIPVSILLLSGYDILLTYVITYYVQVISPRIQKSR